MHSHRDAIVALAHERKLPAADLERWLAFSNADQTALLETVRKLRMRTGQIAVMIALLSAIGLRENQPVAVVLTRDDILRIINGAGSGPQKAAKLLDRLREIRYPRLSATRAALEEIIGALHMPAGIAVILPAELSSDELKMELRARNNRDLRTMLQALESRTSDFERIFAILAGAEEADPSRGETHEL